VVPEGQVAVGGLRAADRCRVQGNRLTLIEVLAGRRSDRFRNGEELSDGSRRDLRASSILEDLVSHAVDRLELSRSVEVARGGIGANSLGEAI
jgi:hypothetical protein